MDGGAWWAAVRGVTISLTRLSDSPFPFHFANQKFVFKESADAYGSKVP